MNKQLYLFVSLALIGNVRPVLGAPLIDSVVESNGQIVITGTGFGSHPDYSPADSSKLNKAWMAFNSGRPTGEGFTITEGMTSNWRTTAEGSRSSGGFHAQKFFNDGRLGALAFKQNANPGRWYTSFWFKLLPNTQSGKFFRMWADAPGNNVYLATGGNDTMIRGFSEATGLIPAPATQWSSPQQLGSEWHRIEIWMSANPSEFTVWMDGIHQWTKTNWIPENFLTANHTWDLGNMIDDPAVSGGKDGAFCFDDIYLSNTLARVELTESSRLDFSRSREIQVPVEWSDTRIVVRRNLGAFSPTAATYVHVVNADGQPTGEGRRLTTQGSEAPAPPTVQTGSAVEVALGRLAPLTGYVVQNPPQPSLVTVWSQIEGPSGVQLRDPYATITAATMRHPGRYIFRLYAFDGRSVVYADQSVTVIGGENQSPLVDVRNVARPGSQQPVEFVYELTAPAPVKIAVLDRMGREVVSLVDEQQPVGTYRTFWEGQASDGQDVASGLYVALVKISSRVEYKKIVLIR